MGVGQMLWKLQPTFLISNHKLKHFPDEDMAKKLCS